MGNLSEGALWIALGELDQDRGRSHQVTWWCSRAAKVHALPWLRSGRSRVRWLVVLIVLFLVTTPYSIYSLGFYWKATARACDRAHMAPSLSAREGFLKTGAERASSIFSVLPDLVGFRGADRCSFAARDLKLIGQGECPFYLLEGVPCRCGADRWPDDAQCVDPKCIRYEEEPRFSCEH